MNKLKLSCTILFLLLAQLLYCQAENASVSLEELQEIEMNLKQSSKEIKNSTKSLNDIGKKIETIRSNSEQKPANFLDIKLYDDDFIKLAFRFLINLIAILLIARTIYYPLAKRKDYLFTYIMISILVFFICFTLKKFELGLGMALGLFAIFGIIRYRTLPLQTEEMTYLFVTIGVAVINALSEDFLTVNELIIINIIIILFILFGEIILKKLSYGNLSHPLDEDINRRVIIQLEYNSNIKDSINKEIKNYEENLDIKIKSFKIFKIDKKLNTASIHAYY